MNELMTFKEIKGVQRMRDVDLGRVLGMKQPANIRQTIAKYVREKKLNDYDVVTQRVMNIPSGQDKSHNPAFGREIAEYWLTEEACLFVGGRSDAPESTKIMRMLIAAFEELRRQNGFVSKVLSDYFLTAPAQLKDRLFSGLIRELISLRKETIVGNPAWGPLLANLVYEWSLKAHGQQAYRRKLNPRPNGSKVDYVWLSGEGLGACKHVIQTGIDFARSCSKANESWEEWKYRMELTFGTRIVQLQLPNPFATKPKRLKRKSRKAA